jgi:hypothetical protein
MYRNLISGKISSQPRKAIALSVNKDSVCFWSVIVGNMFFEWRVDVHGFSNITKYLLRNTEDDLSLELHHNRQ